jgi:hypothetical protein
MSQDPRKAIVEVMARLGRETQLHLDERARHFRITDAVTLAVSLVILVTAIFNVYYVRVLYSDLQGIVFNMVSMHSHLTMVDKDMIVITGKVGQFEQHMQNMTPIQSNMSSVALTLPQTRANMTEIAHDMGVVEQNMGLISQGMGNMDQHLNAMKAGVSLMRANVRQISGPMGAMNPMLP